MPIVVIKPRVYLVGGPELTYYLDAYFYAIITERENIILIDSGCGRGYINTLRNILELGLSPRKVKYIINTHCHVDVSGGDYYFYNAFNTTVIAHEPDSLIIQQGDCEKTLARKLNLDFKPTPVSISLRGAYEKMIIDDVELRIYHCPGHTRGSILILATIDQSNILFGGDTITRSNGGFKVELHSNCMDKLLNLDYEVACFNRFYVRYKAREFIERILTKCRYPL